MPDTVHDTVLFHWLNQFEITFVVSNVTSYIFAAYSNMGKASAI